MRDGGHYHVRMFAAADEPTEPLAQPHLRLPAEVLNGLRQPVDAGLDVLGDLGRVAIGPGAFNQRPPRAAVARFGDAPCRRDGPLEYSNGIRPTNAAS